MRPAPLLLLALLILAGCSPERRQLRTCLTENSPFVEQHGTREYAGFLAIWEAYLMGEGFLEGANRAAYEAFIPRVPTEAASYPMLEVCSEFQDCWMAASPSGALAPAFCMSTLGDASWAQAFDTAADSEAGFDTAFFQDALARMTPAQFKHIEFRGLFLVWAFNAAFHANDAGMSS